MSRLCFCFFWCKVYLVVTTDFKEKCMTATSLCVPFLIKNRQTRNLVMASETRYFQSYFHDLNHPSCESLVCWVAWKESGWSAHELTTFILRNISIRWTIFEFNSCVFSKTICSSVVFIVSSFYCGIIVRSFTIRTNWFESSLWMLMKLEYNLLILLSCINVRILCCGSVYTRFWHQWSD